VVDPVLGYRGRPDFEGRFAPPGKFDVRVRHDGNGFRAQEHAKPPEACRRRLDVYGDSFVWGWGVDQGEVFTDLLNRDLPDTCVGNLGLNASGTVIQYTLFETEGSRRIAPGDTVLVLFCHNDFADNYDQEEEASAVIEDGRVRRLPPRRPFQSPTRAFLKQNVYLYSLVSFVAAQLRQSSGQDRDEERMLKHAGIEADDPRLVVTEHFLAVFRDDVRGRGARFLVAYIPPGAEYGEPRRDAERESQAAALYRTALTGILERQGIEFVDLLPDFLAAKRSHPELALTLERDAHWARSGHALVAQVIARAVETH
jgi:hypothetical protein